MPKIVNYLDKTQDNFVNKILYSFYFKDGPV